MNYNLNMHVYLIINKKHQKDIEERIKKGRAKSGIKILHFFLSEQEEI